MLIEFIKNKRKPQKFYYQSDGYSSKQRNYLNSGHIWEETSEGYINLFPTDMPDGHNGPKCIKCGYSECWHCHPSPPPCPIKEASDFNDI